MILTTCETVPGRDISQHLGLVKGNTVRAKHVGRDFMASLKNLIGGEIGGYTELMAESRAQAEQRLVEEARKLGADAVLAVRYSTSQITQGAAEILVYGTAVKLK
ncbi:MAG: YbjQ family protein [Planctomycetales bacterium]|nr:YbjQ family protein [Planctomycetales bacterium]